MYIILDLIAIIATIGFIFLLPFFYWLLFGRNNSVTARERRAKYKLQARRKRDKLKLSARHKREKLKLARRNRV